MKGIDLRHLKQWLGKGEIEEVAREVGIQASMASKIMSGDQRNYSFAEKIALRAQKNKALKEQIESI